jgi:hypothetical protein
MSLKDWLNSDWLVRHRTTAGEIEGLLGIAKGDLEQSRLEGLTPDWRLIIAYNAALQAATAALAASGYRAGRESHHYRIIQSLAFTIGFDSDSIALMDQFRKKRNISSYERTGTVSEMEASEMVALSERLTMEVIQWLEIHHPELL